MSIANTTSTPVSYSAVGGLSSLPTYNYNPNANVKFKNGIASIFTDEGTLASDYYNQMYNDQSYIDQLAASIKSDQDGYTDVSDLNRNFLSVGDILDVGKVSKESGLSYSPYIYYKVGDQVLSNFDVGSMYALNPNYSQNSNQPKYIKASSHENYPNIALEENPIMALIKRDPGRYSSLNPLIKPGISLYNLSSSPDSFEEWRSKTDPTYVPSRLNTPEGKHRFNTSEENDVLSRKLRGENPYPQYNRFNTLEENDFLSRKLRDIMLPQLYNRYNQYADEFLNGKVTEVGQIGKLTSADKQAVLDAYKAVLYSGNRSDQNFVTEKMLSELAKTNPNAVQRDANGNITAISNQYLGDLMSSAGKNAGKQIKTSMTEKSMGPIGTILSLAGAAFGVPFLSLAGSVFNTGQALSSGNIGGALMGGLGMYNVAGGMANNANFANTNPLAMGSQVYSKFDPASFIGDKLGLSGTVGNTVGGAVLGGGLSALSGGDIGQGALSGGLSSLSSSTAQNYGIDPTLAKTMSSFIMNKMRPTTKRTR